MKLASYSLRPLLACRPEELPADRRKTLPVCNRANLESAPPALDNAEER